MMQDSSQVTFKLAGLQRTSTLKTDAQGSQWVARRLLALYVPAESQMLSCGQTGSLSAIKMNASGSGHHPIPRQFMT